ncbi:hypothetical protein SDC9_30246 [bioreactor metagenome]|uniref:NADH dehydrogenase subunit E n=1 Tax=bioreactor metagenome TaxID=1076179 RepID=A0A644UZC0_9ZZZZ
MVKIAICFGSACHLRGSYGVLTAFKDLLQEYTVEGVIELAGEFCQGRCNEGVVIQINDEVITNVSEDNVQDIFKEKVLGKILCK